MANPQPDKYTKISNELLDALIRYRIPGEQMQVFLCVMRKTYGFNKKKDEISLTQFEEHTGLKRPAVARSIKSLVTKGLLRCNKSVTGGTNIYEIIKDFDKWERVVTKVLPSNKDVKKGVTEVLHTKDTITKDNKDIVHFFEECWKMYPNKVGKGRISDTKKRQSFKLGEEFKRCIERYLEYVGKKRKTEFKDLQYQNGSTFWNSGYLDYTDDNYEESKEQTFKPKIFKPEEIRRIPLNHGS